MNIEKPLLSTNNCDINSTDESLLNSQKKDQDLVLDEENQQTNYNLENDGKEVQENVKIEIQKDEQESESEVKPIKERKFTVYVLITLQFLLLSISLHFERTNDSYSNYIRHRYELLGISIAVLLILSFQTFKYPIKKFLVISFSLILCLLAQVMQITFYQSLFTDNTYKNVSVCGAYFISGSLGLYGISFLFPKIDKEKVKFAVAAVYIIVLIFLILYLSSFMVINSALVGGVYSATVIGLIEDKTFKSFQKSVLYAQKMWIIFIPFMICTIFYIYFYKNNASF